MQAIQYQSGILHVIDQLLLPWKTVFIHLPDSKSAHDAISTMKVRGAPAIAIVAALSVASEISLLKFSTPADIHKFIIEALNYLLTSRPTAVNLRQAVTTLSHLVDDALMLNNVEFIRSEYCKAAQAMLENDISDNKNIGKHGLNYLITKFPQKRLRILTHCNTGSLATAGYGTALGIIRSLFYDSILDHCFCTETRPYNQGSRLTAYELVFETIPSTLITDSMVSALLKSKDIDAIIVGADRVAANGDTANKIGTYQLAITARYHGVEFIVAAPSTTFDLLIESGIDIPIEERKADELVVVSGQDVRDPNLSASVRTAAPGINVWNPAFDVTPNELISAIVTERGVLTREKGAFDIKNFFNSE